ncbi:hypothetical protein BDD16_002119 [Sphaerotilus montanus]|jgi:hypothetical protein|uniref:Uncharacterized protein n=1 Tax=Sphaerotilus montanus TaxID=522889 RepID=A0A7Y9U5N5_9BURK|nr:hypothetical protein [Sphaerotilus montanus]
MNRHRANTLETAGAVAGRWKVRRWPVLLGAAAVAVF